MLAQEEDLAFFIFIAVGVLIVALIFFFGVRSSKKKNRATEPAYRLSVRWEAGQPVLTTSSMEAYASKRQWEIFQQHFAPGTEVPDLPVSDPAAKDPGAEPRTLRVSRLAREARAGYPKGKIGFNAYFEPYEFAELPRTFAVSGRKPRTVGLTAEGVAVHDESGAVIWQSAWAECRFAGTQNELKLANGTLAFDRDRVAEHETLEAVLTKYSGLLGRFLQ